jgi:transposase
LVEVVLVSDAEAIAEAVQRPTMKFVATKTVDQLDLQAMHRVRERLVGQRTGIINQIRLFAGTWRCCSARIARRVADHPSATVRHPVSAHGAGA